MTLSILRCRSSAFHYDLSTFNVSNLSQYHQFNQSNHWLLKLKLPRFTEIIHKKMSRNNDDEINKNDKANEEEENEDKKSGGSASSQQQSKLNFDNVTIEHKCELPGEFQFIVPGITFQ